MMTETGAQNPAPFMDPAIELFEGQTGQWEVVIGLEVHAQVTSNSKLFSGASTAFGSEPNDQVSFVDAAMPGMLPVLNQKCVEQAVKTGLGLNAKINLHSRFDRKNYFYPDLPQGYQISQFYKPIVGEGQLELHTSRGPKTVRISRIHLEQDAGKSMHDQGDYSLIDLNRAGIALMEIVTEPDMRSSEEAAEFLKKLRSILRYLETCDGDMESGSMRCDANVSVRRKGEKKLGTRVEVKNVNSIKYLTAAINYEIARQIGVIEGGDAIDQETRLFDADKGETRSMRSKEDVNDYRYFPDPDLLPVQLTEEYVDNIRRTLPELPDQKKQRYVNELALKLYDAEVIVADMATAKYFEEGVKLCDPKLFANWIAAELFGRLNKANINIAASPVSAAQLAELVNLITDETISGKIAKQVFDLMFETGKNPKTLVEEQGLSQVRDTSLIERLVDEVIAANQDKVTEYKNGKDKLFGFFVGQVMKNSQGKANPELVNEILKAKL
jgi:aspartyl-tRNA(Asn)/glutamyl-tRNA(Gln) amidotransferase subunit B